MRGGLAKKRHLLRKCEKRWRKKNIMIFLKHQGNDFTIHCQFVDDMMHIPTCDALKQEFMEK